MLGRNCGSSRRLGMERLESRQMLSADGFGTTPLTSVTSSNGDTFEIGVDRRGRVVIASETMDLTGSVKLSVNDYKITNADNTVFTGSLETESSFVAIPEAGPGRTRLRLSFAALLELAAEEINRVEGGGFLVSEPQGGFDTLTLESAAFGGTPDAPASITVSTGLLYKPFAQISGGGDAERVGEPVDFAIGVRDTLFSSPIIDKSQPVELRIDFGDGTVVTQTVTQTVLPINVSHTYAEPGNYTVTVSGTATARGTTSSVGGTIALREVCRDVRVLRDATVTDTPGDDNISLRNENGRLIAAVNGVDEDLGASEEIVQVEIQLTRGNNTVDASGLLESQSLFVPAIVNLDSETNTITGGPGDDTIFGGRGADLIFAGLGDDTVTGNRGDDVVHGQGGDDTFVIPGGFNFGAAFESELKELFGGEGFDILHIADLQDELLMLTPQFSDEEFEAQLNLFKGVGSSRPEVQAFIADLEKLFIAPQSEEVNVNLPNADYLEQVEVNGSPEDDRFNFTNSQLEALAQLFGGDDEYLGGAGSDVVDGGAGDDDLNGNAGPDALTGGPGTNTLNGGADNDLYQFEVANGEMESTAITDSSGDADTIFYTITTEPSTSADAISVSVDLGAGGSQQVTDDLSISLNLSAGAPIENVAVSSAVDSAEVTGTTGDNRFTIVPQPTGDGSLDTPEVTFNDGGGGNDTFDVVLDAEPLFDVDIPTSAFDISEGLVTVKSQHAPNSGDVLDYGPSAIVSAEFPDAFRAVNVDLDQLGVDQVVDANGNTMRFEGPIRDFVGSAFDDTLLVDASLAPRRVAGGDGADSVTIDAGGRPVTQTVDRGVTTVEVAGFAPIVVSEFETITVANEGTPGVLALDLSSGDDDALLSLQAIVTDGVTTLGRFTLTEALDAFAEQAFLHRDGVTEIRSAGGADTITLDALGQPVEVIGSDVLIGDLPAIRLVGFSEVTVVDAGLPGDYNRDRVVNAADYSLWRDNVGAEVGTLPNDADGGPIGQAQYDTWRANYGRASSPQVHALSPATASASTQPSLAQLVAADAVFADLGAGTATQASVALREEVRVAPPREIGDLLLLSDQGAGVEEDQVDRLDCDGVSRATEGGPSGERYDRHAPEGGVTSRLRGLFTGASRGHLATRR